MDEEPLPPALRSRLDLASDRSVDVATSPTPVPITLLGTTYTMAQEATWIDDEHFAVGRWDGTLGIYTFAQSAAQGPVINCAVNSPAQEGIQMITSLDQRSFASSNDDETIAIWSTASSPPWTDARVRALLRYDPRFGAANSGVMPRADAGVRYFVVGHANGYVTIWRDRDALQDWVAVGAVDIRSPNPVNPWGLHNIRGIDQVVRGPGMPLWVVAGSEDGDLTILEVPSGRVISKTCYNAAAKRGINALCVDGTILLIANCAVGPTDRNLWAYVVDPNSGRIVPTDAVNLAVDSTAPQVFNFDVAWDRESSSHPRVFYTSTEEGVLWVGSAAPSGKLTVLGNVPATRPIGLGQLLNLGSAVCVSRDRISVANYDLSQFVASSSQKVSPL